MDYAYVGGSQNPLKDPVPQGTLKFTTVLPDGQYEFRYMWVEFVCHFLFRYMWVEFVG